VIGDGHIQWRELVAELKHAENPENKLTKLNGLCSQVFLSFFLSFVIPSFIPHFPSLFADDDERLGTLQL
jgi:hypothetical protein